jgi:hypothetical protein
MRKMLLAAALLTACGSEGPTWNGLPADYTFAGVTPITSDLASTADSTIRLADMGVHLGEDLRMRQIATYEIRSNPPVGQSPTILRTFKDTVFWAFKVDGHVLVIDHPASQGIAKPDTVAWCNGNDQVFAFTRRWQLWNNAAIAKEVHMSRTPPSCLQ